MQYRLTERELFELYQLILFREDPYSQMYFTWQRLYLREWPNEHLAR